MLPKKQDYKRHSGFLRSNRKRTPTKGALEVWVVSQLYDSKRLEVPNVGFFFFFLKAALEATRKRKWKKVLVG